MPPGAVTHRHPDGQGHYVAAVTIAHGRFDIDLAGPAHPGDAGLAGFIDERVALLADPAVPAAACGCGSPPAEA